MEHSTAAFMLQLKHIFCYSSVVDVEELITIFQVKKKKITINLENFIKLPSA